MADDPKTVSRRWIEDGYGRGGTSVLRELAVGDWLEAESIPAQLEAFHTGFPDLAGTIEEQVAEGNRVVTRCVFRGTHNGDFMGFPPSGRTIEFALVEIHTVVDGKIVDTWNDLNFASIFIQIGAIEPPAF